jgi:hypothetical protein
MRSLNWLSQNLNKQDRLQAAGREGFRAVAVKKYYVVTEFSLRDLEDAVNGAIEGDQAFPIGGVATSWKIGWREQLQLRQQGGYQRVRRWGIRQVFHQAMVDMPDDAPTTED